MTIPDTEAETLAFLERIRAEERQRCAKIAKDSANREWQFALRLSGAERDKRVHGRVVAEHIAKDILRSEQGKA